MMRHSSLLGFVHRLSWCWYMLPFGLLSLAGDASAKIYQYIDPQGRLYFTDRKQDSSYYFVGELVFTDDGRVVHRKGFDAAQFRANKRKFDPLIRRIARQHRLESELVQAVVYVESSYDPDARSHAGCIGLMQLKPSTARRYGIDNAWPPEANILAGTRYLRDLLRMFDGDKRLALAGYNAGENAVLRNHRRIPNYPETQRYVRKVMKYYRLLKKQSRRRLASR